MGKFTGLKIMSAGFCIGVFSAGCVYLFDSKAFLIGAFAGWCVGVFGLAVHFYVMVKHRAGR